MIGPRIYHFILDHRVGGPHVYVDTLRGAMAQSVSSVIITSGRGPLTDYALLSLRHFWAPLYALEIVLNVLLLVAWVIEGKVQRQSSVFAVHGALNLAPLIAGRLLGLPITWHFHETTPRFVSLVAFGRWVLKGGRYTLAVVSKKSTAVYNLGSPEFLPGAVDTAFWSRNALGQSVHCDCFWSALPKLELQPLRFLAVGNLNPLKGMDIILCALERLTVPWHLKIVGAELHTHISYAADLYKHAEMISKNNAGSYIEFLGWQNRENVRSLLAGCDVFVLPSRSEACPLALLEAMAMGCRCLAADVGDVRLMVAGYPLCTVVPVESVDDFYNGLLEVSRDDAVALRGESELGADWKLDELAKRAESIYLNLLNQVNK